MLEKTKIIGSGVLVASMLIVGRIGAGISIPMFLVMVVLKLMSIIEISFLGILGYSFLVAFFGLVSFYGGIVLALLLSEKMKIINNIRDYRYER